MAMDKYEEWVCAFESKIKSKSFEQFSLLMMDFKTAKEEQRFLLYQILFENHQSPNLWRKYIEFAFKEFGGKKLYLQRLINKALELLDEKQFSNDPSFLSIHLFSIQLKSCNEEKAKYFQNILFKRSIGVGFAELFLSWAKVAPTSGSAEGSSLYTSSEVLEKGIESNAEPTIVFRRNSGMNGELSSSQTKAVDLNLELETEEVEEETTKIASTEEVRKLLHQAMSESIKPPQPHSFSVQSCSSLEANFSENLKRQKANSKSAVDVFDTKIEESSDNSGSLTMKVPTEDLQMLISKLPKRSAEQNSVALISRVAETNKRRKVSFNNRGSATDLPDTILNRQDDIFLKEERYFSLKGKKYFKLSSIGKGGSSSVFKVISTNDGNVFALKTIDLSKHFEEEDEGNQVFESYANEINLLNTLRHSSPFIIELVDYQIFREERKIAMLLELGEIDLAKLLVQSMKQSPHNLAFQSQFPSLDPIYSRMLWKEMLMAVQHIHDNRIIHGDLKPANFVMVKGHLKLIDFGIAKSISVDTTNIYRDSQIGTINYMAPEAINPQFDANIELDNNFPQRKGMKIGRPSDVWSLGCILYQMIFGKPPFASLNTIQKLMAIPNSDYEIFYPLCPDSDAVETIRSCLVRNPSERARICGTEGLMKQPYLQLPAQSAKEVKQISNQKEQEYFPVNNRITRQRLLELVNMEFPSPQTRNKVARWVESLSANNFAGCDIEYENIEVAGNDYNFAEVKAPLGKRSEHLKITALTPIDRENEKHKVLPSRLRQEIMQSENRLISVQSEEAIVRASKWMKNEILEPSDMKSILEKKMVQMRKFLDVDQDNRTTTESLNLTNFYNQI